MAEHRRWVHPWVAVLVAAALIWSGAAVLGSGESAIDMTGHWASPLEASGIDIVQSGSRVWGSSLSGLSFEGVISGRRVEFTYWRGRSFERADPEDRGSGVMAVAKNGQRAAVTWRNDKKKPDEGSFVIVRVGPPDTTVSQAALADDDVAGPDPQASRPPEDGTSQAVVDMEFQRGEQQDVEDSLDDLRPQEQSDLYDVVESVTGEPTGGPAWTPPPMTQEEWDTIESVLDELYQEIDSIASQILDVLIDGSAEQFDEGATP